MDIRNIKYLMKHHHDYWQTAIGGRSICTFSKALSEVLKILWNAVFMGKNVLKKLHESI